MGPEEVDEGERPSCLRGLERISQFTWNGETDGSEPALASEEVLVSWGWGDK